MTEPITISSSLVTVTSKSTPRVGSGSPNPVMNNNNHLLDGGNLKKDISTRVFCLLAISGSIGAGLLLASGGALQRGGPGSLVVAFSLVGVTVWCVMCALGELSASFPVRGSFYDYSVRFVSPSWGFAMGWNYVLNFMLIVAFEITVIVIIGSFWVHPSTSGGGTTTTTTSTVVSSGLLTAVPACLAVLVGIQAFGAKGYGEAEHIFGILKVVILMVFVITGIVIVSGGTKEAGGRGFENWQDGQAFLHGVPGFLSNFVAAGMAYGGTEMLGLTVAECKHPRKVMPLGSMIVIGRIILCYILPLTMVGFTLKPAAFSLPEFAHLHLVSPFVAAVRVARIPVLPHLINGVLLLSVFSMANASMFASSRAMVAICASGMGPGILARVTERGVPRNALIVVFCVAQLSWVAAAPSGAVIFDWLLSLASVSNYFTWISICICHLRLRKVMKLRGHSTKELEWESPLGVYGSYFAIVVILLCMLAQVVSSSLPPVLETNMSRVEILFMGILGFIVTALCFVGHLVVAARKEDTPWSEKLLIPIEHITLPELGVVRSPDDNGELGLGGEEK